jgi:hypothetical protein
MVQVLGRLTALVGLIGATAMPPQAAEPSRGACQCYADSGPDQGPDRHLAAVENASLCVSVQDSAMVPHCRMQVLCLQEGMGPECSGSARDVVEKLAAGQAAGSPVEAPV